MFETSEENSMVWTERQIKEKKSTNEVVQITWSWQKILVDTPNDIIHDHWS